MKKLKIRRKGFGFELVDESKIKSYEQYHKDETRKQAEEQIYEYLVSVVPKAQNTNDYVVGMHSYIELAAAQYALKQLAAHLADNLEN